MKLRYTYVTGLIFFVLAGSISTPSFAQFGDAGEILRSGQQDANTLFRAYLEPVGKGFGADLNSGWFSTAKTHSTLGFDLTLNVSAAVVPAAGQAFNVQDLTLDEIEYISNGPETPTVAGPDVTGARVGSQTRLPGGERVFEFDLPQGSGMPYVPAPMLQASVGLIKSTDVTLRYLPSSSISDDVNVDIFGIGIKHEINQWLPGGKILPVDLSVQAGFTKFNASIDFTVQPEVDANTENPYDASTWEGQKGEFSVNAFTVNALVGKTLPFISVFGGIGYQASSVEIGTPGSYPVVIPNEDYNPGDPNSNAKIIDSIEDPIDITYDDNSSFHGVIGARLKLLVFNISTSYTLSEYPIAQLGIGIGIR